MFSLNSKIVYGPASGSLSEEYIYQPTSVVGSNIKSNCLDSE